VVDDCSSGYPLHRFSLDLPAPELAVIADVDMLRQVLRNLLDNAAKFSPEGGPVDVRVYDHPGKGTVTVAIEDEGIGVMPSDRERLFQTFARGSNPEVRTIQGVGLGLYTSKSLSESMGCQINFSRRRGRGSRFSLDIPMAA
jgi:signal transduction histidine kinase